MVAAAFAERSRTGVRAFEPHRDLEAVVELIDVSFGDRLDPAGRVTLGKMRRLARRSRLWGWLWPLWGQAGITPGFVWVAEERVVGNVSLRRAASGNGYLIGNVVVHPDWRGRGIASALMEAAVDNISARGGRWVGLEVRVDNEVAYGLYERLGFREVGTTLHMLRPAGLAWREDAPSLPSLRRGRSRDGDALVDLVHAVVPEKQRPLLEIRQDDYRPSWDRALSQWLKGRRQSWWVVEENDALRGAVRAVREPGRYPNRLEVLVRPEHDGGVETALTQKGVADLGGSTGKDIEARLPNPAGRSAEALESVGFEKLRVLVQMRMNLVHRVPVRS